MKSHLLIELGLGVYICFYFAGSQDHREDLSPRLRSHLLPFCTRGASVLVACGCRSCVGVLVVVRMSVFRVWSYDTVIESDCSQVGVQGYVIDIIVVSILSAGWGEHGCSFFGLVACAGVSGRQAWLYLLAASAASQGPTHMSMLLSCMDQVLIITCRCRCESGLGHEPNAHLHEAVYVGMQGYGLHRTLLVQEAVHGKRSWHAAHEAALW